MKIIVGQLGGRMYYGVPRILHEAQMLHSLHTDYVANKMPLSLFLPFVGDNARNKLANRMPQISSSNIHQILSESFRHNFVLRISKLKGEPLWKEYLRFGHSLEKSIIHSEFRNADAVFMIGSSSSQVFPQAKKKGLLTIMEQIIAPPLYTHQILESEWAKYPSWEKSDSITKSLKFWGEVNKRDWEFADVIVCGSQFVADAIKAIDGPSERCVVVPYGVPSQNSIAIKEFDGDRLLRVLTVGSVGLRKGVPYIFEAAKELTNKCEFVVAGGFHDGLINSLNLPENIKLTGHLSRLELEKYFEWADVFLLPSLSEGSATVCYEAIMFGLPLIVTHNTGSFITDGKEGYIIPIKSSNAIIVALNKFISAPYLIKKMSKNVQQLSGYASFDEYKLRLLNAIKR